MATSLAPVALPKPAAFWLYFPTIACSAALLFVVQPIVAKSILPRFGGTAGVWATCMLFFQATLLLGYLYSYVVTRFLGRRTQTLLHLGMLLLSLLPLPLAPQLDGGLGSPVLSILFILSTSVGLPYFALSTTSPLLQSWLAQSSEARIPYKLFALSNAASLLALFAYPLLVEPLLPQNQQLQLWSAAYLVFVILAAGVALAGRTGPWTVPDAGESAPAGQTLMWIALAACASALWLSVAHHLRQEVAPIPFLWVLPLGIYLLTFILCFEGHDWYRPALFRYLLPLAWVAVCCLLSLPGALGGLGMELLIFSASLFIFCMFCHGELASRKPHPKQGLPFFYLATALGGALGGVFVALVAPNLFSTYLELPISIVGCVFLALISVYGVTSSRRLLRFALVAVAAFIFATRIQGLNTTVTHRRNFYGVLQVREEGTGTNRYRALYSGNTLHGVQYLDPARSRESVSFYGAESGIALAMNSRSKANRRVAIIGLGAGSLATYGRAGDSFRFYEINPVVAQVAQTDFRFLAESKAATSIVLADGRLALEKEPPANFDLLVLDAFSDDAIPVHLLTREAFQLYFQKLQPDGLLALHITNRYLDLNPVVKAIANSLQKRVIFIHNASDPEQHIFSADWALVFDASTFPEWAVSGSPAPVHNPSAHLWTDDFSNLFRVLR